jgi:peroxiredoxin
MRNITGGWFLGFPVLLVSVLVALSQVAPSPVLEGQSRLLSHTLQATNAQAAWTELENSEVRPPAPTEWQTRRPSKEDQERFLIPYVLALEDRAKAFYTTFANDSHASEAKLQECNFISLALRLGAKDQQARLDNLEKSLMADTNVTEQQRFDLRLDDVKRMVKAKEPEGQAAMVAELEKDARVLEKEFPQNEEPQKVLLEAASASEPTKARAIYREIADNPVSDALKEIADGRLRRLDIRDGPMELHFTAVDGREVDLAKLKGKVVLLDFWATWCPPCVREVPNVVETYNKLHSKGLEIVGISLDKDKSSLTQFVAAHSMEWPQYFDGLYWQNKLARRFGVEGVPQVWLIDKHGQVRDMLQDMDALENLSGKVEKLLAE